MLVYYLLAAVAIWLGLLSLRGGLSFYAYVRRELAAPLSDYAPFVSVIAPFRGVDEGFAENLTTLFEQHYPAYEILFVTDLIADPGLQMVEEVRASLSDKLQFVDDLQILPIQGGANDLREDLEAHVDDNLKIVGPFASRIVIAGAASDSGQKVHNLRRAVAEIDSRTQVIVFVDSDVRLHPDWLRSLVAPLGDDNVGATTGYRWFTGSRTSLCGQLRSVWNASIASALGERRDRNFCWGGSTAIRRRTFDELNVADKLIGSVSDDFTLTRILQQAKLPIKFVPQCLVISADDCSLHELLEFTTRQLKITRVYAAHLWKAVLLGSTQFVLVFFGGLVLVITRWWLGLSIEIAAVMLSIIFVLGAAKSLIRLRAVKLALANYHRLLRMGTPSHILLWPLASALFLYNAVAASFSRRIKWRGITYELKSPVEAVIIARESD